VPGRSRQIKARVFEVPGAGGFLLTEPADGLDQLYRNGNEIAVFDGLAELVGKIAYFMAHPEQRDKIALAGHARTRNEHTYEMRFSQLLNAAMQQKVHSAGKPHDIDFQRFNAIAKQHATGLTLRIFKLILLLPCMAIWGKARGPRAARRILFELSWRLVGKKTYSVSGWPGRLFYKES
jgi:spore maturation protein CgeB